MASLRTAQGNLDDAAALYREVYEAQKAAHGDRNPNTLSSAAFYREAERVFRQARDGAQSKFSSRST